MLFKASITKQVVVDEDKLVEQLYIFLKEYVSSRLKSETEESKEDCIQEVIMKMLNRYRKDRLNNIFDSSFNYEKYFYNRAMQYVSSYLRTVITDRKKMREWYDEYIHLTKALMSSDISIDSTTQSMYHANGAGQGSRVDSNVLSDLDYLDYSLIVKVSSMYGLSPQEAQQVADLANNKLIEMGYIGVYSQMTDIDPVLEALSYVVLDRYLMKLTDESEDEL